MFAFGNVNWNSLEVLGLDEQLQYDNPSWFDMCQWWVGNFDLILTLFAKLGQYTNLALNSPFLVTFFYPLLGHVSIDTWRFLCMCWNCLPLLGLYDANITKSYVLESFWSSCLGSESVAGSYVKPANFDGSFNVLLYVDFYYSCNLFVNSFTVKHFGNHICSTRLGQDFILCIVDGVLE